MTRPGGRAIGSGSLWGRPISVQHNPTNRYDSDISTVHTIGILRKLAHQYAGDPSVHAALAQACGALGPRATERDIVDAIFYWIRAHVRFVDEEELLLQLGVPAADLDKELLIVPPVLLAMPTPMGDCDDFSLLAACMSLAAGLQCYFVTVAADDAEGPRKFSHIYVCVRLADEGSHVCLDAGNRMQNIPPGWEASKVTRKAIWRV